MQCQYFFNAAVWQARITAGLPQCSLSQHRRVACNLAWQQHGDVPGGNQGKSHGAPPRATEPQHVGAATDALHAAGGGQLGAAWQHDGAG
ncbi:MAG: hypothetical protein HKN47_07555 [Pirellulaceae bacterium]|nr:hypothetical protein [Pirellulaceae bacterium]